MMTETVATRLQALERQLRELGQVAIAISGGVDSTTLAVVAGRTLGNPRCEMFHSVSPAVPAAATARVRRYAAREGWSLQLLNAGEFADTAYSTNPVDRCFYCKTNLYRSIARLTQAIIVSGANRDDLNDYRPGLRAANDYGVGHPFIEAGIDKAMVRAIARRLGLTELAELPASPCLSSRVETGIPIQPTALALIQRVEALVSREIQPGAVRCRLRHTGVTIELDQASLATLSGDHLSRLAVMIEPWCRHAGLAPFLGFEPYRTGSAFLHNAGHGERDIKLDFQRRVRLGLDEAIFCDHKTLAQLTAILEQARERDTTLLLTRLDELQFAALSESHRAHMDYEPVSRTAYYGIVQAPASARTVAVVTAGTSDIAVSREAVRTLIYHGVGCEEINDVGVAGLWRLLERVEELRILSVLIVTAGMDAALPSVIAGLVPGLVIAVPSSVGYGVAQGGETALRAALASCAPGVVVVNIDNGYGAACAALKILNSFYAMFLGNLP